MPAVPFEIRPVSAADHTAWLPLWQGYQRFYKTEIAEATSAVTWQRFLDPAELQRRYPLAPPAEYLVYPPERDGADETPAVRCTEHGFAILASRYPTARHFP